MTAKVMRLRRTASSDAPPTEYDGGNAIMALAARVVAEGAKEAIILYVTEEGGRGWWPSDGMTIDDGLIAVEICRAGLIDSLLSDDEE